MNNLKHSTCTISAVCRMAGNQNMSLGAPIITSISEKMNRGKAPMVTSVAAPGAVMFELLLLCLDEVVEQFTIICCNTQMHF